MPISKPFAIATEGPTIDGRNISRDMLAQMAKSYDPKVYTAVLNLEHYLSAAPDSVFGSYGKVVALGTQEAEILGEKKLQLTAVVDVAQGAVDMQKAGKKAFSSMEVKDNFINKGIHYLTGLAFTDKPASVGTESMKFSAFSGEKDSVYCFGAEISIDFDDPTAPPPAGETLLSKVKDLLGLNKKDADGRFSDIGKAVEVVATSQKDTLTEFAALKTQVADLSTQLKAATDAGKAHETAFAELKSQLDKTTTGTQRPPATGTNGDVKTDC